MSLVIKVSNSTGLRSNTQSRISRKKMYAYIKLAMKKGWAQYTIIMTNMNAKTGRKQ